VNMIFIILGLNSDRTST